MAEKAGELADDTFAWRARDALPECTPEANTCLAGALEALRKLCEYGIIAEQPVASIEDMAALRFRHCQRGAAFARIAADESIRKAEDLLKVARQCERRGPHGY